jgi:hypothetical protein
LQSNACVIIAPRKTAKQNRVVEEYSHGLLLPRIGRTSSKQVSPREDNIVQLSRKLRRTSVEFYNCYAWALPPRRPTDTVIDYGCKILEPSGNMIFKRDLYELIPVKGKHFVNHSLCEQECDIAMRRIGAAPLKFFELEGFQQESPVTVHVFQIPKDIGVNLA